MQKEKCKVKYLPKLWVVILYLHFLSVQAEENTIKDSKAFVPGFAYIGEFVNNFTGGIKTGSTYLGLVDLSLNVKLENFGLWKGGEFYLQLEHTHGGTPTADLVGDYQVFSNIENGNYIYLYELWYKHTIGNLCVQAGIIDLNADFLVSDNGRLYANSSLGIMPVVSMNMPVPIFPKNALGLLFAYKINNQFRLQTVLFDGDPGTLDDQKNGLDLKLSSDEGLLSVSELHYSNKNFNGLYRIGLAYHSGNFINIVDSTDKKGNVALYTIIDQVIIPEKLSLFFKTGLALKDYNYTCLFLGGGLNITAPVSSRIQDMLGLAIANACISSVIIDEFSQVFHTKEIAVEFTYLAQITDFLGIQPYFQYIINPGMDVSLENALIGAVRLNIEF